MEGQVKKQESSCKGVSYHPPSYLPTFPALASAISPALRYCNPLPPLQVKITSLAQVQGTRYRGVRKSRWRGEWGGEGHGVCFRGRREGQGR